MKRCGNRPVQFILPLIVAFSLIGFYGCDSSSSSSKSRSKMAKLSLYEGNYSGTKTGTLTIKRDGLATEQKMTSESIALSIDASGRLQNLDICGEKVTNIEIDYTGSFSLSKKVDCPVEELDTGTSSDLQEYGSCPADYSATGSVNETGISVDESLNAECEGASVEHQSHTEVNPEPTTEPTPTPTPVGSGGSTTSKPDDGKPEPEPEPEPKPEDGKPSIAGG